MKLVLAVGLVASSVSCLNTSGLHDRYVVKDSHSIPDGWINRGPAPGDHPITLHVGLREGMGLELEQFVNQGAAAIYLSIIIRPLRIYVVTDRLLPSEQFPTLTALATVNIFPKSN